MTNEQLVPDKKGPMFVWGGGKKAKPEMMARSLRALAISLRVGGSEARALEIAGEQFTKFDVGRSYTSAAESMREHGMSFKQAMLAEDIFPRTVRELIAAAPTAQTMHKNLLQAAKLVAQAQDVKKKILTSLIQPGFMLGMCLVFLFVASAFIIPGFVTMFASLDSETPQLTLIVMAAADVAKYVVGGLIVLIILLAVFWLVYGKRSPKIRRLMDTISVRTPVLGDIVQLAATSRLFELLSANLETGMGEPNALEAAAAGCGNEAIGYHCDQHAKKMRDVGAPLKEFADTNLMPVNARHMLGMAPSVRQEIEMMSELAPEYRNEANQQLEAFSKTIEPLVTYIVYAVAGFLIIAITVPMYSMFPALMNYGS